MLSKIDVGLVLKQTVLFIQSFRIVLTSKILLEVVLVISAL